MVNASSAPQWNQLFRDSAHSMSANGTQSYVLNDISISGTGEVIVAVSVNTDLADITLEVYGRVFDPATEDWGEWILQKTMRSTTQALAPTADWGEPAIHPDYQGVALPNASSPNATDQTSFYCCVKAMDSVRLMIRHASDTSSVNGYVWA